MSAVGEAFAADCEASAARPKSSASQSAVLDDHVTFTAFCDCPSKVRIERPADKAPTAIGDDSRLDGYQMVGGNALIWSW
jgi:hypothetical protein